MVYLKVPQLKLQVTTWGAAPFACNPHEGFVISPFDVPILGPCDQVMNALQKNSTEKKVETKKNIPFEKPPHKKGITSWWFPKIGCGKTPQNGWFISGNSLLKCIIWGAHPYSWKHPYI